MSACLSVYLPVCLLVCLCVPPSLVAEPKVQDQKPQIHSVTKPEKLNLPVPKAILPEGGAASLSAHGVLEPGLSLAV